MGFAAGFQAGYGAVTSGFAAGVRLADLNRKEKELKLKEDEAISKKLAIADEKAAKKWKEVTDTQIAFEEKIGLEQNYKKRNALKEAYQNTLNTKYNEFMTDAKDTPYAEKYAQLYVQPQKDMLEKEVPFRVNIDGDTKEFVVPENMYQTLTDMYSSSKEAFTTNPDGSLAIRNPDPEKQGKYLDTASGSFRRSQTTKIKAYDDAGNVVMAYDDEIEKKNLLREKPTKDGFTRIWKGNRQVELKTEAARKLANDPNSGYTFNKPDGDSVASKQDINKQKLKVASIQKKINTAKSMGDTDKEVQLKDALQDAQNELTVMKGGDAPAEIEEKTFKPMEVISKTTNTKAINSAINKMVEKDEEGFQKAFINADYDTQVKMLDSKNQYATNAWIKTQSSSLKDILEKGGREDENGYMVYPSQEFNRKMLEIKSMNMNSETKKELVTQLVSEYESLSKAQVRDKDDTFWSNTFVENLIGEKNTYEDLDARNFSIQKIIEEKATFNVEYMGGIKLDSSYSPFASSDRFNEQSMPVLKMAYEKLTGRELTPEAWKRIAEKGIERDSFNPDLSGQAGTIVDGSELDRLLRYIFKSKR